MVARQLVEREQHRDLWPKAFPQPLGLVLASKGQQGLEMGLLEATAQHHGCCPAAPQGSSLQACAEAVSLTPQEKLSGSDSVSSELRFQPFCRDRDQQDSPSPASLHSQPWPALPPWNLLPSRTWGSHRSPKVPVRSH